MIPDKIYCGNNGHGNLSYSTEKVYPSMEEYIRKDALLEWAREYLDLKIYDTKRAVMEELIDKLNSI